MRIAHISDIHVARPPASGEWNPKRLLGYLNYLLFRGRAYTEDAARAALSALLESPPDLAVLTGDITQHGLDAEFAGARELLAPLVRAGIPVIAVPGNHDVYGRGERPALRAFLRDLAGGADVGGGGIIRCGGAADPVEILPLFQCIPTPPLCSYGRQDPDELARAGAAWRGAPAAGVKRVVIGHYPVIDPHGGRLLRYRGLRGAETLLEFCAAHSVSAYFCGHDHRRFTAPMPGGCVQYAAPALSSARGKGCARADVVRL